jgi:regulator of protease activity HflC (stomatin/prohibitin superfamily)
MADKPMKLIVDLSKPEGEREQYIPLTAEEIAEREEMAAQAEADRLAREAEEKRIADLKASAKAKLVSGEKLTAEEAALLIG